MALSSKIVDLIGLSLVENFHEVRAITQICIIKPVGSFTDPGSTARNDAVDFVPFAGQQFRQVMTVLPGDASDQCSFCWFSHRQSSM